MIKITNTLTNFSLQNLPKNLPFSLKKTIFIDIETTGFSASNSMLYLIGCIFFPNDGYATYVQFFCDDKNEKKLLQAFHDFAKNYSVMVYFNGKTFDIPYLSHKYKMYQLDFNFDDFEQFDLYGKAKDYKRILQTSNLKQKTLETFFGIDRNDIFSGGELIELYHTYLKTKSEELLKTLLLHNAEDIEGMLTILNLYKYDLLFQGNFSVDSCSIHNYTSFEGTQKQELLLTLILPYNIPQRISGKTSDFFFLAENNICKIKAEIYHNRLKFFYPDYKNYYYLPKEDYAIHKSVASFVEKKFRTQAKADNCYTYFEITEDVLNDENRLFQYALMVLKQILNHG